MFGSRITLFKLLGFEVRIDSSWIILAVLITWSLAKGVFPTYFRELTPADYWLMGAAGAIGLFLSIIFHEFSHSIVARRFGLPMKGITLFIFGGVAEMSDEPPNAKAEFFMAVMGPVSSLFIGAVCFGVLQLGESQRWPLPVNAILFYLAWVNVVLAIFNLLPAFPLDGGRVFRSILWGYKKDFHWATRISTRWGSFFGVLFIAWGVWEIMVGNFIGGLWQAMIGMFLRSAAQSSYQQVLIRDSLSGLNIGRFMVADPVTVPPDISLRTFVDQYLYRHHHRLYPVLSQGRLVGCVEVNRMKDYPAADWDRKLISEIAVPCDRGRVVGPETDALEALRLMNETGNSRLMVVSDGRLIGIVTLKDLMQVMALRMEIEQGRGGLGRLDQRHA